MSDRFLDKVAKMHGEHARLARELAEMLEECGLTAAACMARTLERDSREVVEDCYDFTPIGDIHATGK